MPTKMSVQENQHLTAYELLSLTITQRERANILARFWVSLNFAVLAGAFIAGPQLTPLAGVAMVVLYSLATFVVMANLHVITYMLEALAEDREALVAAADGPPQCISFQPGKHQLGLNFGMRAIQIVMFAGTVLFVLSASGIVPLAVMK